MFHDVDVVIGCLDNREADCGSIDAAGKSALPWIDGGIQEINGVVEDLCSAGWILL